MAQRAKNVLDYLEASAKQFPDKEAYEDKDTVLTFDQIRTYARKVGTALANQVEGYREPVAVFMDKSVQSIAAFFGVVYSGNFYCPLDTKMPVERIQIIMGVLKPQVVVTDLAHKELAESFADGTKVVVWEDLISKEEDDNQLAAIQAQMTEHDPLYVLFTSGSTGVPKGVLLNHRVVTNYMEWLDEHFDIDSTAVFGNQAPFYFDVSIHDIYGTLYFGAKMVIIPKSYFSFPRQKSIHIFMGAFSNGNRCKFTDI